MVKRLRLGGVVVVGGGSGALLDVCRYYAAASHATNAVLSTSHTAIRQVSTRNPTTNNHSPTTAAMSRVCSDEIATWTSIKELVRDVPEVIQLHGLPSPPRHRHHYSDRRATPLPILVSSSSTSPDEGDAVVATTHDATTDAAVSATASSSSPTDHRVATNSTTTTTTTPYRVTKVLSQGEFLSRIAEALSAEDDNVVGTGDDNVVGTDDAPSSSSHNHSTNRDNADDLIVNMTLWLSLHRCCSANEAIQYTTQRGISALFTQLLGGEDGGGRRRFGVAFGLYDLLSRYGFSLGPKTISRLFDNAMYDPSDANDGAHAGFAEEPRLKAAPPRGSQRRQGVGHATPTGGRPTPQQQQHHHGYDSSFSNPSHPTPMREVPAWMTAPRTRPSDLAILPPPPTRSVVQPPPPATTDTFIPQSLRTSQRNIRAVPRALAFEVAVGTLDPFSFYGSGSNTTRRVSSSPSSSSYLPLPKFPSGGNTSSNSSSNSTTVSSRLPRDCDDDEYDGRKLDDVASSSLVDTEEAQPSWGSVRVSGTTPPHSVDGDGDGVGMVIPSMRPPVIHTATNVNQHAMDVVIDSSPPTGGMSSTTTSQHHHLKRQVPTQQQLKGKEEAAFLIALQALVSSSEQRMGKHSRHHHSVRPDRAVVDVARNAVVMTGWERAFGLWQGRYLTQPLSAAPPPTSNTNNTTTPQATVNTRLVVSPPSINTSVITRRAVECLLTVLTAMPQRITATTSHTSTTNDVLVGDVTTAGISVTLLRLLLSTSRVAVASGSPSPVPSPVSPIATEGGGDVAVGLSDTVGQQHVGDITSCTSNKDGPLNVSTDDYGSNETNQEVVGQVSTPRGRTTTAPLSVEACAVGAQLCMNNGRMWKLALEWASTGVSIIETHLSSSSSPIPPSSSSSYTTTPLPHSPPLLTSFPAVVVSTPRRESGSSSPQPPNTTTRSPMSISARKLYKVAITAARKGKQEDIVGRLMMAMGEDAPPPQQPRATVAHLPFSGSAHRPSSSPSQSRPARQSPSRYHNKTGGNNHHSSSDKGWNHSPPS